MDKTGPRPKNLRVYRQTSRNRITAFIIADATRNLRWQIVDAIRTQTNSRVNYYTIHCTLSVFSVYVSRCIVLNSGLKMETYQAIGTAL